MSQITLCMGPNAYALQQERLRWVSEFKKRQGEDGLFRADSKKITFKELHNECQAAPFLADKRLMIIDGVPSRGSKEEVQQLENLLHPSAHLLFVLETDSIKKPKLSIPAKELVKIANVQEFPNLSTNELLQWLQQKIVESGAESMDEAAKKSLLQTVGENQALLATEVEKLSTYAFQRAITVEDVQLLASSSTEQDVWQLMDFLGAGNIAGALHFIHSLLDKGYSPQALWSTFLWMITQLTQIVAVVEAGETNPWKIAGIVRANPYGVKAILPFARTVSRERLRNIVQTAVEADQGLKTGRYKATSEAPEEILTLIDRSLFAFST